MVACTFHLKLSLFDDYFIQNYNELNHRDNAQINVSSDKNLTEKLLFIVSRPSCYTINMSILWGTNFGIKSGIIV